MYYSVDCSRLMHTDAKTLRTLICDLRKWPSWSPWLCLDPDAQLQYSDDSRMMSWRSNVVGEGEMEKMDSEENAQRIQLRFFKPFKSKAEATLRWHEENGTCTVTWEMRGNMPWFLFFLIKMMKGWIRMDYRRGLQRLALMAQKGKIPAKLSLQQQTVHKQAFDFIGIERKKVLFDDLATTMQKDVQEVFTHITKTPEDTFVCLYDKVSVADDTFDYAVGLACTRQPPTIPATGGWVKRHINEHSVLRVQLDGPYEFLGDAWSMAMMSVKPKGHKQNKRIPPYEVYEKNPENTKNETKYKTYIDVPVTG